MDRGINLERAVHLSIAIRIVEAVFIKMLEMFKINFVDYTNIPIDLQMSD